MPRTRLLLSLDVADYERLRTVAAEERTLPATLAARVLNEWLSLKAGPQNPSSAPPAQALMNWLAPHVDRVRDAGGWPQNVAASLFGLIEREAPELYRAAEADLGRAILNQSIGRMIRNRLGAEVVRRNGKPVAARVPAGTTSLVKTVTLIQPRKGFAHA